MNRARTLGVRLSTPALMILALLCAAPTPGDIGGCGADPTPIAPDRYANARKRLECDRCKECSVSTARCARACDPKAPSDVVLPATCRPLEHDAEVCLRSLIAASCTSFAQAVDDVAPTSPSECLFCREGAPGNTDGALPQFLDAGPDAAADGAR